MNSLLLGAQAELYRFAADVTDLIGRAGGGSGGGRSSGGGSSGGSSGGFSSGSSGIGGGGGSAIGALFALIFGGVCLFVIVIIVILVMRSARKRGSAVPTAAGMAAAAAAMQQQPPTMLGDQNAATITNASAVETGIAKIKEHDPAFNADDFLSDCNRAFFTIQQAWTERKPEISRQVMHDGVWNQHKFQIEQYVTANKQNVLENLAIQNIRMVAANSDESFDTINVRYFASCSDYDIDLSSEKHKVTRGSQKIEDWAEDWVFQRSSRAVTKPNATMKSKCPNCGAPLDLDLAGICKYCKAPVMSGEFDWVLTRIEQLQSYEFALQSLPT